MASENGNKLDLLAGAALLVAGIILMANPVFGSVAVTKLTGWVFMISGVMAVGSALMGRAKNWFWGLLGGIVIAVAGGLLAFNPLKGTIALTFLFTLWLFVEGATNILGALFTSGNRIPLLLVGVINLVLGFMLWGEFPTSSAWLLGVFAGISLVMRGMMLMLLSRMSNTPPPAAPAAA